jgi:spore coat protein H
MTPENPVWVGATIGFNGQTWTNVGVRYKGNSSLRGAWGSGSLKLPFKLDFDEFEDDHPEVKNQRFYGFDQLSLGNNFSDAAWMRDSLAYDLLESAGLVAAHTAFYDVVVDYGEGPVNLGIYTAVEVIDDTVIARAFGDDSGNIYEADGRAATLSAGTEEQIEISFQKENNRQSGWSDIKRLYAVLHASTRTSDPAAWRSELESIFDVDTFLEWLALSGAMQHWDTYGAMTHNYYLYNNPETGRLTWISWDHNMILGSGGGPGGPRGPRGQAIVQPDTRQANTQPGEAQADSQQVHGLPALPADGAQPATGPAGQRPGRGMGPSRSVTLDKQSVGKSWPLIRFLLDDPVYSATYVRYVESISADVFVPSRLEAKYQAWAALLAPYADRDGARAQFDAAVQELTAKTHQQSEVMAAFLATQQGR